jgi:hypothetical protein
MNSLGDILWDAKSEAVSPFGEFSRSKIHTYLH